MNNNKDNKITIKNKLDLNLTDFDKKKFNINLNRLAFIFLIIFFFIILFSTRVIYLSSKTFQNDSYKINKINRADITDRNGAYISKSVFTSNVGVDPKLVKDKKKIIIKIKIYFSR